MNKFYTYAYLREDRTPYYIGKGQGNRVYRKNKNDIKPPKDKSRIIFLKQNLTEEEAFKHEIYMIVVFGRKDLGTGILHNKTDGGEGVCGLKRTEKYKIQKSFAMQNYYKDPDNYAKLCKHNKKVGEMAVLKNRARQRTHWRKDVWDLIENNWISSGGSFRWGRADVIRKTGSTSQEIRAILRLVKCGLTWEDALKGHHVR